MPFIIGVGSGSNANTNDFTDALKLKLENITDNFKGLFSNSTDRDLAVTSPQNSFYVLQSDTDTLWYYNGLTWIDTGSSSSGDMLRAIYDPSNRSSDVYSVDNHQDGLTNAVYTLAERSKLAGISTNATTNQTDSFLIDRGNHTGAQPISTVTGLQTALDSKVDSEAGKGLSTNDFSTTLKNKLDDIQTGATVNSTDAQLRDRSTHTGTQPHTTITGLGSAATATVTTSATDATAGRLLKVGDFGIGSAPPITLNADDVSTTGFFTVTAEWVGSPFPSIDGANQGYLSNQIWDSTSYRKQEFFDVNSNWHTLTRRMDNGVWSEWVKDYNQRNILGQVSQSAGIPTGAIIETGSNANGSYVRYANGTQVCTQRMDTGVGATFDGAFRSPTFSWTYPIVFSDTPVFSVAIEKVVGGASGVFPVSVSRIAALSLDSATLDSLYVFYTAADENVITSVGLTAIGRWY